MRATSFRLASVLVVLITSGTAFASPSPDVTNRRPLTVSESRAPQLAFLIRGGCPYNLDKECHRNRHGRMVCRCVS
jgi:hypothetical protein